MIELPPLPKPDALGNRTLFTKEQMHEYGKTCRVQLLKAITLECTLQYPSGFFRYGKNVRYGLVDDIWKMIREPC
jgi:hypothetical protein